MRLSLLILTFLLVSTIEVSSSRASEENSAQAPSPNSLRAELKQAVLAWKRLISCQSIAAEKGKEAAYSRCLENAMPVGGDKFDQMKMTEFLLLEMPVTDLGHCPAALEAAQTRRQSKFHDSRFACFLVSADKDAKKNPIGGEVEFAANKNGELKVRRIRYSF